MKYILPEEVTESMLFSSSVPLDDYAEWSAGTYNSGDEVRYELSAYRAAPTTTDRPDVGADKDTPTWVRLGYVNRWRGLRDGPDSKTTRVGGVEYVIDPNKTVTSVAVLGCEGFEIQLTITDDTSGIVYDETKPLLDFLVDNFFDWFWEPYTGIPDVVFEDLPPYLGAQIKVEARGADVTESASIGRFSMGVPVDLGVAVYGTNVSRLETAIRERDEFGNLTLVPRRSIPVVDYRVTLNTNDFDRTERNLAAVSTVPCVYIGEDSFTSTILFGIHVDFRMNISGPTVSDATIEVEGF